MRSLLALTVSVLALTGCVTENSYDGNDKPVVENKINNVGAARTRIALALQYLNTGNNSQAKYNLERAASFAPNLPEVHYSFAYYYQQVGENILADKSYQKALEINPDDPNTRNNYGVFLCGIDEYDRATEQLLKAISIPSYIRVAESYENLALCAIEFDDFDNAEKYFISAIKHSSMRASSLISLAALYYAKSDLHKAQALLERYENSGQISSRSLFLSYLIEQRMGHIEKAETTAATILQTYPTTNEAVLIREQRIKHSEFEILRLQYRQAKLDELKENSPSGTFNSAPKMRIVKKKKAPPKTTAAQAINKPTSIDSVTTQKNDVVRASSNDLNSALLTVPAEPTKAEPVTEVELQSTETITKQPVNISSPPVDTGAVLAALAIIETNVTEEQPAIVTPPTQVVKQVQKNNDAAAVMSALALTPDKNETPDTPIEHTASSVIIPDVIVEKAPEPTLAVPTVHLAANQQITQPVVNKNVPAVVSVDTKPVTKKETPPQDGIKIVSFGAPSTNNNNTNNNSSQAAPTNQVQFSSELSEDEKVVFYQPQRNEAVFAGQNERYSNQPEVRFSGTEQYNQAPMLNSRVPQLTTPYHVLQDGENLFSISVRYNVKLQKLLQWNGLRESDRVANGTNIYLNDPNIYYKINTGDTLYSIATERRLLIDQLMRWNKLSPDVALKPGHRLLLVDPESYAL